MTLRARQRDNQRWRRQRFLTRLANPVIQRDRPLHLHLIQRDERGGLFLPCTPNRPLALPGAEAGRSNQSDHFNRFDNVSQVEQKEQKGSAA